MPHRESFSSNEEYNKYHREYRAKNAEKMRQYKREYNRNWRLANGYESNKRYAIKWKEKNKAQRILSYAVKIGLLTRESCEICGDKNSQGHHEDYSKPAFVRWLCPIHHSAVHTGRLILSKKISTGL